LNLYFAESGIRALEILEEESIAVIITDLNMPSFTGVEFLKICSNKYPNIKKMILSVYSHKNIIDSLLKENIFAYIPKSDLQKESAYQKLLLNKIKQALKSYNKNQER